MLLPREAEDLKEASLQCGAKQAGDQAGWLQLMWRQMVHESAAKCLVAGDLYAHGIVCTFNDYFVLC